MEDKPAKQPLLNNTLKLFMLAMILANIGSQMYGALMPLYLEDVGGLSIQLGIFRSRRTRLARSCGSA